MSATTKTPGKHAKLPKRTGKPASRTCLSGRAESTNGSRAANTDLVELLRHLADDLCVLHVPEHLDPHRAWSQGDAGVLVKALKCPSGSGTAEAGARLVLPLHPEHWMKKLMRSSSARSLSCLYDSIHSSTTDWRRGERKHRV